MSDVKTKSKQQIAGEYKISIRTMYKWWEYFGIEIPKNVKLLTPLQVQETYDKIGIGPKKTRKQLAYEYGICTKTLKEWWKRAEINIPNNFKFLTPLQVAETYKKCVEP